VIVGKNCIMVKQKAVWFPATGRGRVSAFLPSDYEVRATTDSLKKVVLHPPVYGR